MFRECLAALWLLAICLPAHAQSSSNRTDAKVIHAPVDYPAAAVSAREQGTVMVKFQVDTNGRAADATVDKSSGYPDLDAAAVRSLSHWSFSPGTMDGKPQAQWIIVPVNFQLKEEPSSELPVRWYLRSFISYLVRDFGSLIWLVGFVWSVVLAKRKSILWLSGMVALWAVTYPMFVIVHWSAARQNLIVVALGLLLMGLGLYLMPPPLPSM